jgi:multidrug transporter EmrE-like cation transporter
VGREREERLPHHWLLLTLAIVANALGNLMLKVFSQRTEDNSFLVYLSPWFVAGILFFLVNLMLYAKALRGLPQNIAYPVMVSGTVLIVMTASVIWFSERLQLTAIAGAVLIIAGIALLTQ